MEAGKVINFVSNDVVRMDEIATNFMFCTTSVLDISINVALMCVLLGWQSLSGLLAAGLLAYLQVILSKQFAKYREKQAIATDKRLSAMNDVVRGIRLVKMNGWEDNHIQLVRSLRRYQTILCPSS